MIGRASRFILGLLLVLFWTAALRAQEPPESSKWMLEVSYNKTISYFGISGAGSEAGASLHVGSVSDQPDKTIVRRTFLHFSYTMTDDTVAVRVWLSFSSTAKDS